MKNREKYEYKLSEFRDAAINKVTREFVSCRGFDCADCLLNKKYMDCDDYYREWLDEEYIEPRIEFKEMEVVEVKDDTDYWTVGYFKEYTEGGFVRIYKFSDKTDTFSYKHVRKVVQNDRSN